MQIHLHNIGRLEDATVIIDGITVIAGENNTGKSTVGKALFSFFNAFHNVDDQIEEARRTSLRNALRQGFGRPIYGFLEAAMKMNWVFWQN